MRIGIDGKIFELFPEAKIGWLLADVKVTPSDAYIDKIKSGLAYSLREIGLSQDTMMLHPDVARWREVYSKMGVKPSKYRSSIEALLRRVFKGDIWSVSNVVDCYDCVSALTLLPMGAHDITAIKGDLTLRFGYENEKFYPLGAGESVIDVSTKNILYADEEKVCCWLWNYRDTRDASVTEKTERALFLVDQAFSTEWRTVREGLDLLSEELEKIGCTHLESGIADIASPYSEIFQ